MPCNALRHNDVDHELPVDEIASLLVRLAHEPVDGTRRPAPPTRIGEEVALARLERRGIDYMDSLGDLTAFTCPTCRGALWELDAGGHLHYRCHTGHSFSQASLLIEQGTAIEESVYMALRAVEEKATALRRLAERWDDRYPMLRDDYRKRAADLDQVASVLRELLAGAAPSENMAPP